MQPAASPAFMERNSRRSPRRARARAFSGLGLVFTLSFLSLAGVLFTFPFIGGLGDWSLGQAVGVFGAIEAGAGLGNIISPDIWRLPVAELQTKRSTTIRLAASAIFIPHWGGAARAAAGVILMIAAATMEGVGPVSLTLPLLVALLASIVVTASAVIARAGVARPDLDVIQIVVRRAGTDRELPPISIGASAFQMLLSIATIPAIKSLPPSILYRPDFGASPPLLLGAAVVAAAMAALMLLVWRQRVTVDAGSDQQRDAEEFA
jgi:hypothetical protein